MKKTFYYLITILIVSIINVWNLIIGVKSQMEYSRQVFDGFNLECPLSLYNTFFLCNINYKPAALYLLLIPIMVTLVNWENLKKSTKPDLKNLFKSIVIGFIMSLSILFIFFFITAGIFPAISPQLSTGYFPLAYRGSILADLYLYHPFLYICVFILLISVYSALYSAFVYSVNLIYRNRVVTMIFVFLAQIGITRLLKTLQLENLNASNLFIPTNTFYETGFMDYIFSYSIIFSLTLFIFLIESRSKKNAKSKEI